MDNYQEEIAKIARERDYKNRDEVRFVFVLQEVKC